MDSSKVPRLIVVTGKGGVGKTSLALAITKHLHESGIKVLYNSFDQITNDKLCEQMKIPFWEMSTAKSAEAYIAKKLNSEMVAGWIMKTPFFKSLFNMIPGLGMMILLGHIIEKLQNDPDLHIVMDSPSSGHAITMFESSHNFKEMFGKGMIVDDINRMHQFIYNEKRLRTIVVTLPTLMAVNEGIDLKKSLNDLEITNVSLIVNDAIHLADELNHQDEELPSFLAKKIEMEKEVVSEFEGKFAKILPHLSTSNEVENIKGLTKHLEGLW
jgi:anion-transporting  ArsA/GET3 family ATPase